MAQKKITRRSYGQEDHLRAVAAYITTGSTLKAAKLVGIPQTTISLWTRQEWWGPMAEQVWAENEAQIRAELTEIVTAGHREVLDRLEHGDERLTKNGEKVRVKMPGRDCMIAAA